MLRSAEEILRENHYDRRDPEIDIDSLIIIINQARKEAIQEAADRVEIEWDEMSIKSTVLSLLNEIK